jgi:acyl-CoA dehydrogenase
MNELRAILADSVGRLLGDLVTPELLQAAEEDGGWPTALWEALDAGGLTRALLPENRGGAGGSWGDVQVVLRAAGRFAAPVPLGETILAGWLLGQAGLDVPDGPLTVAPGDELAVDDTGARVTGTAANVPWGRNAGHVVALTKNGHVALVAAAAARVAAGRNLAREPRDTLTFTDAPAATTAASLAGDTVWRLGALLRAAQMAGALDALLARTVRYANERVQFGKPIGRFQAIQHALAVLAEQVAAAGVAVEVAFRALERGDAMVEIAAAKVRAGEAAEVGAAIAHQVHGAIGFTYEHTLHFTTRRLWAWRGEFGGESHWAAILGREAASRGGAGLWPWVTSR